ncbi:MAG: DUF1559 domain-containing protein [Planctomycetota bacterium]
MKFRLWTILWVFALLASSLTTFGGWGVAWSLVIIGFWSVNFRMVRFTLSGWIVGAIVLIVVIVLCLLPAVQSSRVSSRRSSCLNNMKQIALALHFYADDYGKLPPAYTVDDDGNPLHSWRVLILPYLEHGNLYKRVKLDEPWDSLENQKLWQYMPDVYRCPSCDIACGYGAAPYAAHSTNYFAAIGADTCWPGSHPVSFRQISDGCSNTILFVDAVILGSCWMEPRDLTMGEAMEVLCGDNQLGHLTVDAGFFSTSTYSYYGQAAFADGHCKMIYNGADRGLAAAMLTRSGNETLDADGIRSEYSKRYVATVYHWKRIYSFAMFSLLAVLPVFNLRRRS